METVRDFIFLGSKITADGDCSHAIKRCLLLGRKAMTNLDSILKSKDIANKDPSSQSYGFSSSYVWMWELDHKVERWRTDTFEPWCWRRLLSWEDSLDYKEVKPVNLKGNQSWMFIGRTDAEAKASVLWPPDVKNWLTRKDPDAGKNGRQEEKGTTEDEIVGWHYQLDGHVFEQALGVGDGQGSLACCSPWDCKELETAEWLNWTQVYTRIRVEGPSRFISLHIVTDFYVGLHLIMGLDVVSIMIRSLCLLQFGS